MAPGADERGDGIVPHGRPRASRASWTGSTRSTRWPTAAPDSSGGSSPIPATPPTSSSPDKSVVHRQYVGVGEYRGAVRLHLSIRAYDGDGQAPRMVRPAGQDAHGALVDKGGDAAFRRGRAAAAQASEHARAIRALHSHSRSVFPCRSRWNKPPESRAQTMLQRSISAGYSHNINLIPL